MRGMFPVQHEGDWDPFHLEDRARPARDQEHPMDNPDMCSATILNGKKEGWGVKVVRYSVKHVINVKELLVGDVAPL